jgi:protein involved in polysaccharide export with SLBB domain
MKSPSKKFQFLFVLIGVVCFFLIGSVTLQAQTIPPVIQAQINAELQKRGLTESEVRARLLQKGIDLENVPPAELPQYQSRVIAVLDELQAEKKAGNNNSPQITINVPQIGPSIDSTAIPQNKPLETVIPATTKQEAAAEGALRVLQVAESKMVAGSNIYGHSIFTDKTLDVFRTTDGAQTPETYVLGDGDEIRITIFGASQTDIQQQIGIDGSIQPSGGAKIFLKGLSLAQAREVIKGRLSSSYTFRPDQLAVTVSTARTVLVNVFGEAKITGGFTISALNSALNALSAAGGPTEIGSVRSIQLIRGETRKSIDLYAFMNDPATQFKFDLQNNDIIFVPVVKSLVTIEGAVNRPMSYEMLPNETLADLIHYAGGVKMDVFPDFVQIQRYVNGEQRLMEYNLADVRSGKTKVNLMNGDVIHIKAIAKPMDQYVNIEGSVYYPGKYDLSSNSTLQSLLDNAKLTDRAKTDFLFIERLRSDSTIEILNLPFPAQNAGSDVKLQPRDKVKIMDQVTYRDVATIAVNGQVRAPFERNFSLTDRITVKKAIEFAGGLKNSAYPVAYIFRRNLFNPVEMKYIRIELNEADNIELQPGDQLNIYDNTTYTNVGEVKVFGAVKNPRGFTYDPSLTVRDVLTTAGGFNVGAAFNRVEIFRTTLSPTEKAALKMITLEVDSNYQVINPKNFTLQPYDQVVVRLTPDFKLGRTVELNGEVVYPGVYALESKRVQLSEIIKRAGGLLPTADPIGSGFFRTFHNRGNISMNVKDAMQNSKNLNSDPILFEGDVININRLENTVSIRGIGTRMAQYSMDEKYTDLKNVIFHGSRSAGWYVRKFAGGFEQDVDRNSVTVTYPNNEMRSTKRLLGVFRNYPNAKPGSMITMKMKPPRPKELEGKKTDWDAIWSKTLAAATTSLSMYFLIRQILP